MLESGFFFLFFLFFLLFNSILQRSQVLYQHYLKRLVANYDVCVWGGGGGGGGGGKGYILRILIS